MATETLENESTTQEPESNKAAARKAKRSKPIAGKPAPKKIPKKKATKKRAAKKPATAKKRVARKSIAKKPAEVDSLQVKSELIQGCTPLCRPTTRRHGPSIVGQAVHRTGQCEAPIDLVACRRRRSIDNKLRGVPDSWSYCLDFGWSDQIEAAYKSIPAPCTLSHSFRSP